MAAFAYEGDFVELCGTGNPEQVREAIEAGAPVNAVGAGFQNALMAAIDWKGKSLPQQTFLEKIAALSDNKSDTTQNVIYEIVSILINSGVNVNYHNIFGGCPLSSAIANGDPSLVKILLNAGAEVDPELGEKKESLLSMLFSDRRTPVPTPEILKILLEANGGVNDRNGNPLLLQAFSQEKAISGELIRVLLDAGADVNGRDAGGRTPLILAAHSDTSIVRLLLERGADVHARVGNTNFNALMSALWGVSNVENVRLLIEAGSDVNAESTKNKFVSYTPLGLAMTWNLDLRIFHMLLENGADIRKANCDNEPLLMAAIKRQNSMKEMYFRGIGTVEMIMQNPAEFISFLIQAGVDVNETAGRDDPRTPLMVAVSDRKFSAEVVKLLLEKGADVNARVSQVSLNAKYGDTALMMASMGQTTPEIIRLLVSYGADVNAANEDGETSLILATCFNPNAQVIQTLIECGANVNSKTVYGRTALMEAALCHKSAEIIRILIDAGADIGVEVLELAEEFNPNEEILKTLRDGYRRRESHS